MKPCQHHRQTLLGAFRERGLMIFVPTYKQGMSFQAAVAFLRVRQDPITGRMVMFDPFNMAEKTLVQNAERTAAELGASSKPEDCPICFVQSQCTCGSPECKAQVDEWVQFAADDQLNEARDRGLVGVA